MFAWWQHYQEPREREEIEEENNYGFNEEADMNFKLF
jgi:hypothetical protein